MAKLEETLDTVVQRTGGTTGAPQNEAEATAFRNAVRTDLASVMNQMNNVYYVLFDSLSKEEQLDALDFGLTGNVIFTHIDATAADSSVFWDSTSGRARTVKETVDVLLSEISRLENSFDFQVDVSAYDDSELSSLIGNNQLNLTQIRKDTMGENYSFDNDGAADLTYPLAQHLDAIGAFFSGWPGTGNTYPGSPVYPTLSLAVNLSDVNLDTTIPVSTITGLSTALTATRLFVGQTNGSDNAPTYSAHGPITHVVDGDNLEKAVQKLDAAIGSTGASTTRKILAPTGSVWFPINTAEETISFPAAPSDLIIKEIYLRILPNGQTGVPDPPPYVYVSSIQIDGGSSITKGLVPVDVFNPRGADEPAVFNQLVTAGQVVTVGFKCAFGTGIDAGFFVQPMITYVEGSSVSGLTQQTYIGLDPAVHTAPPTGLMVFTGASGTAASRTLTVNTSPLVAGDTIDFIHPIGGAMTLVGVAGPRTPGSDNFQVDAGSTTLIAADIAAAINDGANSFSAFFSATPSTNTVVIDVIPAGEKGNFASHSITTTPAGGITPATGTFAGGVADTTEGLSFIASPADLIYQKLYTRVVGSTLSLSANSLYDFQNLQINGGADQLGGCRLSSAYTAPNVGLAGTQHAFNVYSPDISMSVLSTQVVTLDLVNNEADSGGISAAWLATYV